MAFDFDAAEKEAETSEDRPELLAAVVFGQSGAGKSYLAGTFPGKVLYLYTQGEDHGKASAKLAADKFGGNVYPLALDVLKGKVIGYDSAYKRLMAILTDVEGIKAKGYQLVVVDGLSELEHVVRNTTEWEMNCTTKKDGHDKWKEGEASLKQLRPVLDALRALQREAGVHYYVTCIAIIQELAENGEILSASPKVQGFDLPAQLIPQFPDQMIVGSMTNEDGVSARRIQFGAKLSKTVKEANGKTKKFIHFTPRLRNVAQEDLPETMACDLGRVLALKGWEK